MPRKSAAAGMIATPRPSWSTRLRPPPTLSEPARNEFVRIVAAEGANHFRDSDLSLLVQYCEAVALAERAAKALQSDDAERVWLTRWDKATKVMESLAMRLRISPQSRAPNNPSRPAGPAPVLSAYETMALEKPDDDEANH